MRVRNRLAMHVIAAALVGGSLTLWAQSGPPTVVVQTPMSAPPWALAERALLRMNGDAVRIYAARRFDERGYVPGPEQWSVGAGPDDVMEGISNWPLAHALGGPDQIIDTWLKAWEGHLEQYSRAKIPELDLAKDGIFHKEFITSFDWEHTSEGLGPFYFYGLSRPNDPRHIARMRRFAGFYMNEDPDAPNYDPKHKIIRSLFNGSRGPKLTAATVDDWDGPLPAGVSPTAARRTRFLKSSNIRGDHPLNLNVTMLHLHAYLLTQEGKYRDWLLEYVDAWRARTESNGGNIPSNIGLDGRIGGEWGGKWYGGVFGWNSPDEGVRNYVLRGPPEAFGAALLLTGDQKYVQVLRRQVDNLYAAKKVEDGKVRLPRFYGDNGWYGHEEVGSGPTGSLGNLANVLVDLSMWSLLPGDLERVMALPPLTRGTEPKTGWIRYLQGADPEYPMTALQRDLTSVERAVAPAPPNPPPSPPAGAAGGVRGVGGARGGGGRGGANAAATTSLINLTMGGNDPGGSTHGPLPLHVQVRHFDPERRRAGLPEDVAALVERIRPDSVTLTLVNVGSQRERTVTLQMGAYGEHQATVVTAETRKTTVNAPSFNVRLAPGAGATLTIALRRYANRPTLAFPWDRRPGPRDDVPGLKRS